MRIPKLLSIALVIGVAYTPTTIAETFEFNFILEGSQEVPPNGSNAAGAASLFMYDTDTQTFDFDTFIIGIGLDDLLNVGSNATPVHIHLAPPGANGPIVVDLGFHGSFVEDGAGIRLQLNDILLGGVQGGLESDPVANEAALFAGNLYVNVHTESFPGGQLRGQIVPEPTTLLLLATGGFLVLSRRRQRTTRRVL